MIEENSTPVEETPANPATDPGLDTGTVPTDSQATETAPVSEESFTKLDPKNLPPALKASYDEMLRDYKAKTTSVSERVKQETAKAVAEYQEKATLYEQIAQQEEFVKQWNEYVQKQQSQGQEPVEGDPKLVQLEQKFNEINQKLQLSEMTQVMDSFADAVNEKGVKLHPDFDELNSLTIAQGPNGEDFSLLNLCVKLSTGSNPQERLSNGYKQAKAAYTSIFEAGKKAGMGRVQAKVLNGTNPPSNSTGDILSVTDKKPKNAREAMDMAKKGLVVSRG